MQTYYAQLATSGQMSAYDAIKSSLEQKLPYANVYCDTAPDKVYEAVLLDNPLCGLAHPWMECNYDGRAFAFQYISVQENIFFENLDKVESEIREIYDKDQNASAYTLYKTIFDVLSRRIEYAQDIFDEYMRMRAHNATPAELSRFLHRHGSVFSPYGALVEKKAVCNGIAKLFQIVCARFGLPCACVQASNIKYYKRPPSEIADNAPCDHLLNVIEIDGQQMFADLTYGLVTERVPFTVYDLFAVNYNVLKRSYLLRSSDLQMFQCNGVENLYYEKNKLVFSTLGAFRRYLINYISKFSRGQIRVYYKGGKVNDDELGGIFEDIVQAHCPPTKEMSETRCENGFINGAIVDR